jgi:DNA-binding NarL/FixJ family response regulator
MKLFESNVLILDEDLQFSEGLKHQLGTKYSTDVKVFNSIIDCLNGMKQQPDVVFVQHKMSHIDGIRASRMLKRKWKHTRIVLLCMSHSVNKKINKRKFGISKAILKSDDCDQYVKEIRISRAISIVKKLAFLSFFGVISFVLYSVI